MHREWNTYGTNMLCSVSLSYLPGPYETIVALVSASTTDMLASWLGDYVATTMPTKREISDQQVDITRQLERCSSLRCAVHTRAFARIKNTLNSVTVPTRTYVCIRFLDHKGLGNHLLQ
jgi:hypothetical protein